MGRRRYRTLIVGSEMYRWRVAHQHMRETDEHGRPRYVGCREVVLLRKDGRPGRVTVVFRDGPGRIVPDGGPYTHSGGVRRADDTATLNLHRPGVVRALLDIAVGGGEDFGAGSEVDGWQIIDAVWARLAEEA